MDDQDRLSMSVPGGKASFFVGELEEYAWHKLFDSKLSNQDRADLYIKGLDKLSTATKLPELFRDIFKNAYLPFRAPDTIAMFLDVINTFDYHHPEELGNAFEHLLSIMGSQGDAGQFRTPRHIIEFIVKVIAPKKDETIFDPACGTAGFLVEAFNQIKNSSKLTPQELQLLANNIEGFDIDPGMAKLARVNLYLHGFKTPHITENDTLTNENLWLKKKYDVILANPPFMSPKGGIKPHDKFSVKANKSEVLFVNYIAEHLKLHGRAGIIVPEGVIFQSSSSAYKQLRKLLVED
jgi:type I restriction enzyme M protein